MNKYGTRVIRKQSSEFCLEKLLLSLSYLPSAVTPLKNKSLAPQIALKCYEVKAIRQQKPISLYNIIVKETISIFMEDTFITKAHVAPNQKCVAWALKK